MEAIPSLCASTATCGAATIGCAFGRLDATGSGSIRDGLDDFTATRSPPPTLPNISLDSPTISLRSRTLRRPQSALISPSPSLADMLDGPTRRDAVKTGNDWQTPPGADAAATRASEDYYGATKVSWMRRVSAIVSQDGSQSASSRPDSPAVHSNGSNVPFFPPPQASTPRNKLVKRSTSLRILNSGGLDSSPLSTSQTPPLRRPITSHQRTQQLRLHQLQGARDGTDSGTNAGREEEPLSRKVEPVNPSDTKTTGVSESTWHPYFLIQRIRLFRDMPSKSATLGKGTNVAETVHCMRASPNAFPLLVKSTHLMKPTLLGESLYPPLLVKRPPDEFDASRSSNELTTPIPPQKIPKARNSFSFGDIMSTPPTARKLRRGSSSRKLRGQDQAPGRRVFSAPQRSLQTSSVDSPRSAKSQAAQTHSTLPEDHTQPQSLGESSTLPPLRRLSAFQIDLLVDESADPPSPDANRSSSPPASTGDPTDRTGYPSIRFKPHRTSRIASDRASTTFSSEYDQSRIFSAEGDDIDYRSETVYDSIRTEATGSTHSGAKGYHAETVFGKLSPEPSGLIASLPERSAPAGSIGSKSVDTQITEEDGLVRTPIRRARPPSEDTPTPAPRMFLLAPERNNPQQLGNSRDSHPINSLPEEDSDEDNSWFTQDEQMDWQDTSGAAKGDFVGSWTNNPNHSSDHTQVQESIVQDMEMPDGVEAEAVPSQQAVDRDSRAIGRRAYLNPHIRSQSVPLQPDTTNHRFNNTARLDAWILGGKGVSEDWDGDFDFEEPHMAPLPSDSQSTLIEKRPESGGVVVPSSILERQASVHGQFGHVKELTRLVEELRRLRSSASTYGLLEGQQAELWREAEGIIDLATLDEEENLPPQPQSPHSTSFDFDAFEEETSRSRPSTTSQPTQEEARYYPEASRSPDPIALSSSPFGSHSGTPHGRSRKESVAKAKHVLEHIHQHRSALNPLPVDEQDSPRKLPFDTTSLRDLVTRAGVVTRALREIVRRAEDPENNADTQETRSQIPPDPAFSQIFQQPPSPAAPWRSPDTPHRRNSNGCLSGSPSTPGENDRNGHLPIMSAV